MTTTTHSFKDLGTIRHVLKAGTYVITDPCYVFPDEMWSDLCDQIFCRDDNCPESGVIEMDGHKVWWGQTKHGDGGYFVRHHGGKVGEFGVDAGMFAIFPLEFVQKFKPDLLNEITLACTTAIPGGVVSYDDGDMDVGPITVCTSGTDRDDEDEDMDGEDDDDER